MAATPPAVALAHCSCARYGDDAVMLTSPPIT
jgi:hypothetical protein